MYDDVQVVNLTADGTPASNGLNFECRVHKVVLVHADGSAVLNAKLYDAATPTGTIKIEVSTNLADGTTFERNKSEDFYPPVYFETGVALDLTGTGTVKVYFTRV